MPDTETKDLRLTQPAQENQTEVAETALPSPTLPPPEELASLERLIRAPTGNIRASRRDNPLIGACELGDFPYLVLVAIERESPNASGLTVIDFLAETAKAVPDEAQSYSTIKRLLRQGLAEERGKATSPHGGPPIRMLGITEKGIAALEQKERRLKALIAVADAQPARRRPRLVRQ